MNIIIADDRYRVIAKPIATYEDIPCYVIGYRVQIRVWKFWITIKAFNEGDYDDDAEFCKREAIELYNKIVNPYGSF
jgi:hypothetical protein|nr:MAG TPA: hypothetical protein [Crassvirales sp.]